jgi:hypothetical protein
MQNLLSRCKDGLTPVFIELNICVCVPMSACACIVFLKKYKAWLNFTWSLRRIMYCCINFIFFTPYENQQKA